MQFQVGTVANTPKLDKVYDQVPENVSCLRLRHLGDWRVLKSEKAHPARQPYFHLRTLNPRLNVLYVHVHLHVPR